MPGYTGHEMLEQFGLIHMNGRIYDPILARFLSADPVIADAGDIQAYNRYSYVGNSPLNYTDPTGYTKSELAAQSSGGSSLGIILAIAAIVLSVVTAGAFFAVWTGVTLSGGITLALGGTITLTGGLTMTATAFGLMVGAAIGGFVGGFVASGFTLEGALWGAATAIVASGIGSYFDPRVAGAKGSDRFWLETSRRLSHGVTAGAFSEAQGGKFGTAFLASYAGTSAGYELHRADLGPVMGTLGSAVVGGTVSKIGGGKFANGAITSAFEYLFNQARMQEESGPTFADLARDSTEESTVTIIPIRPLFPSTDADGNLNLDAIQSANTMNKVIEKLAIENNQLRMDGTLEKRLTTNRAEGSVKLLVIFVHGDGIAGANIGASTWRALGESKVLADDARVVLVSCSAAAAKRTQDLANRLQRAVYAPPNPIRASIGYSPSSRNTIQMVDQNGPAIFKAIEPKLENRPKKE